MNPTHLTATILVITAIFAGSATLSAAEIPPEIDAAIKSVSALPVFKTGELDNASIAALKDLQSESAFNSTDNLYLVRLDTDHPPAGWGAAGVYRDVTLTPLKVFRGLAKPNVAITLRRKNPNHLGRGPKKGGLTQGSLYVVEAGDKLVKSMTLATPKAAQRAYVQGKLPLGWTLKEGEPRSVFKAKDFERSTPSWTCGATGLSPAMLGRAVTITCKPVPPVKAIKWTNPDGDGYVAITITNTGEVPVEVPALRIADGEIDWARSLISLAWRGGEWSNAQSFKTIKPVSPKKVEASVVLDPKESVTCEVCILDLDGVGNVGGGMRRNYVFCLGQKSASLSFYWMDRHHSKLRNKLLAEQKKNQ